jgi:hypothetical protein
MLRAGILVFLILIFVSVAALASFRLLSVPTPTTNTNTATNTGPSSDALDYLDVWVPSLSWSSKVPYMHGDLSGFERHTQMYTKPGLSQLRLAILTDGWQEDPSLGAGGVQASQVGFLKLSADRKQYLYLLTSGTKLTVFFTSIN